MIAAMTQPTAPIPAGELRATIRDLDARGQRPTGLVMSPETWTILAEGADGDRARVLYAGVPVWTRTDCEGVELVASQAVAADEVEAVWL